MRRRRRCVRVVSPASASVRPRSAGWWQRHRLAPGGAAPGTSEESRPSGSVSPVTHGQFLLDSTLHVTFSHTCHTVSSYWTALYASLSSTPVIQGQFLLDSTLHVTFQHTCHTRSVLTGQHSTRHFLAHLSYKVSSYWTALYTSLSSTPVTQSVLTGQHSMRHFLARLSHTVSSYWTALYTSLSSTPVIQGQFLLDSTLHVTF